MASGTIAIPFTNAYYELADCNDAWVMGRTYIATGSTQNKPPSGWYYIMCIGHYGSMVGQLAVTLNTQYPDAYIRGCDNSGTWGSWKRITLT